MSRFASIFRSPLVFISVVVPLYNEQESIQLLYSSITDAISNALPEYEIIFVDDGSNDNTFHLAKQLAAEDPRLRVLKFRRNYGQTPAMAAGIDHARGEVIVTMDGDLQNDPQDIPNLVDKVYEGFDIVVGWRFNRKDKLITRKIPSRIANWLIGKVTGVPIKDNGCSLKAYRAETIKNIPLYNEMHRFIPAMASIAGPRLAEIKVRHHSRQFGESKYGLSRVYKVLLDLMTIKMVGSFSSRPLYWFSMLALPFLVASIFIITGSLISAMFGGQISIPIAGSGLIFFTLAAFLIVGGAIGELIYKTGTFDATHYPLLTAKVSSDVDSADLQLPVNQKGQIE
ncbi:MAG: glycosyltransferase family 2 protein [Gammaproteobacteria bacterium]|nr:glycosyltransferase family 2 protein [Gammaproteobacteria bacterium]NNC58039.1 glycosyltransferase family 2 protein [Woeseiaceae bacterium]NNL50014.1 glycosyltransferase family 2 protein [Woeseiaceae bacterium]